MNNYKAQFTSVIEESIQCNLYSTTCFTDNLYWLDLRSKIQQLIDTLSCDYIWHKDKFELHSPIPLITPKSDGLPHHLYSTVQFGDNIEDEWFIVYLVFEITKQFKDTIVQLNDNDGEFLLIEAADFLPKWVNCNNTENRVYIYQGELHIIPPDLIDVKVCVCVEDAIHAVTKFSQKTVSKPINNAIQNRLKQYPQKIKDSIHRAKAIIPQHIAALLSLKPELISGLVDAYCNQDYLDKKFYRNMKDNKHTIETSVKFTKFLYAMLTHSKSVNNIKTNKEIDLGLKITAGYEILINKSKDIFCSKKWLKFYNNLKEIDYFNGNIDGSKDYLHLLDKAKEYFTNQECSSITNMANEIENLKKSDKYKAQYELLDTKVCLIEDSDEWLKVVPNELEEFLKSHYGKQAKFEDTGMMTPHNISTQISKFLKESSDFEGIDNDQSDDRIDFDVNEFSDELKNILDFVLPEGPYSDSDEDILSDNEFDMDTCPKDTAMDIELKKSLLKCENEKEETPNKVFMNLTQSMKEEGSASGPSSLLLKNIGINKIDLLDSDDDEYDDKQTIYN